MANLLNKLSLKLLNERIGSHSLSPGQVLRLFEEKFKTEGNPRLHVFLTSFPKSGSSFLRVVLTNLLSLEYQKGTYDWFNEQDLYYPHLMEKWDKEKISHQHSKATPANLELFNRFSIRPVVHFRNLFDVVVSYSDHIVKHRKIPHAFIPESYFDSSQEEQYDFIIDMVIPWYFHFHVSWMDAIGSGKITALVTTYEEMLADELAFFRRILEFYGQSRTDEAIQAAIQASRGKATRKNVGVSGRGARLLTGTQRKKIMKLAERYPGYDFSQIGIPEPA
jgi:hypothetical protein